MTKHINQVNLHFPDDREALIIAAENEREECVSVGGLAGNLGMLGVPQSRTSAPSLGARAFARLVEFWRREHGLSIEALAARAGLDEADVLDAEEGDTVPEPRVLHALSTTLGLPYEKLLHLTGHIANRDQRLETAALRFAARSETTERLSKHEEEALHEFIKALGQ